MVTRKTITRTSLIFGGLFMCGAVLSAVMGDVKGVVINGAVVLVWVTIYFKSK